MYPLKKYMMALMAVMVVCSNLSADEATKEEKSEQRVEIESRHIPHAERMLVQERLAKEEEEGNNVEKENKTALKSLSGAAQVIGSVQAKDKSAKPKALFFTSHNGVFHNPLIYDGVSLQIEDGSVWVVRPGDRYKPLSWLTSDSIVIAPNHSWFNSYGYCLINQVTGQTVDAYMSLGPIYMGPYTQWIVAIDYYNNTILLRDGTLWQMSFTDEGVWNKWFVNDTVIIGINDGSLNSLYRNILINVNTYSNARGDCTNY